MSKSHIAFLILAAPCAALALSSGAAGLFPPVSTLDPALLMPPESAEIGIAPDGGFLVDGKPRYLLGTILYGTPSAADTVPGPGYSPDDAWIYEIIPDRDYLQRLGFDTVGGEVSTTWLREFRPEASFYQARHANDWSLASRYWRSGLPTIVDFTCAGWSHGAMRFEEGRPPSRAAIPDGGAGHFMPYSLVTPDGRDLYARMWRSGADELRANGVRPYAYELFNEPTYEDFSPEARAAFAGELAALFGGDPAAMDAAWGSSYGSFAAAAAFRQPNECVGLGVEWLKFRERVFASGIRLGLETIRAVDPAARVCFQPLGIAFGRVNVIEANRPCGVVMSPTGGGDAFDAMLLRAIADGKPIIDGETYLGPTRSSHRAKILLQWARGFNAFYAFKWDRRLSDPLLKAENGPERLAERFPYLELNPAGVLTEALAGIMDAKRDIAAMQDLFGPRDRGIPPDARVAALFSLPTERLGDVAGHGNHNFTRANATAMAHDAHLPVDAVFEEQLAEGRHRRYRILVAAGIDATRPETLPALRSWVGDGGTLVIAQEAFGLDEYATPRGDAEADFPGIALGAPCKADAQRLEFGNVVADAVPYREVSFAPGAGWRVLASLPDGRPAIAARSLGNGQVVYVGVRFPNAGDEGRLIAAIAARRGVRPVCVTFDFATGAPADGIEVHAARGQGGDTGFVVVNRSLSARAVRFIPGEGFGAPVLADVTRGVRLGRDADGAALLLLESGVPVVLRGCAEGDGLAQTPLEPYADAAARAPGWLDAHRPKTAAREFSVDPARARFLDLREVANRSFVDRIAGDGKGGWTDQGENHLRNVPWGVTECNGVPFDFIRPDQNGDRACVILRSTRQPYLPEAVRGIAVNVRAGALYFLHAAAWLGDGEAFRYVVHYADGTVETVQVLCREDVGDWWIDGRRTRILTRCKPGWTNSEGRGFHVLRWGNPHPEKTIATIDIESACTGTIPIIAAITAELPDESPFAPDKLSFRAWGGVKALASGGAVELAVDDATKDWSGATLRPAAPVALDGDPEAVDFVFDVNGGETPLGARTSGGQGFQIRAVFADADGGEREGPYVTPAIDGGAVDDDQATWQTARVPLRRLLPAGCRAIAVTRVSIQFKALSMNRSGLLLRNLRLLRNPALRTSAQ